MERLKQALKRTGAIIAGNRRESSQPSEHSIIYSTAHWVTTAALLLYALFAPHSIAITQGACLLGLLAWSVQVAISRRLDHARTAVDVVLFGFFACCVVSSFLSYDALVSIKGLKSPAFFLAFYLVSSRLATLKFTRLLILGTIVSCLVNVAATATQVFEGRGLRVDSIAPGSAFDGKGLAAGDVLLEAEGQTLDSEQDLIRIIGNGRGPLRVKFERSESLSEFSVSRQMLKEQADAGHSLGLVTSPGRNFRVSGFYSHYETYAEVLQLIAALAIGLFISLPRGRSVERYFLFCAVALICGALIYTATRAAIIGLAIATVTMAVVSRSRRVLIVCIAMIALALPIAIYKLQSSRGAAVFEPDEGSATYRLEMWREALGIIKDHPLVGIGKGSEAKLKESLELYSGGKLPPGHFHSTLIQIATWWGIPALMFYASLMTIFGIEAVRLTNRLRGRDWQSFGIVLGALGAIVAFNVSSLVHFNFGDGEVVMMLWFITGTLFAVRRLTSESASARAIVPDTLPGSARHSHRNRSPRQAESVEASAQAAKAAKH